MLFYIVICAIMENIIEQAKTILLWCEQKIGEITQDIEEMSNYCQSPFAKPDRKQEMKAAIVVFREQLAEFRKMKQEMVLFCEEIMVDSYKAFRDC